MLKAFFVALIVGILIGSICGLAGVNEQTMRAIAPIMGVIGGAYIGYVRWKMVHGEDAPQEETPNDETGQLEKESMIVRQMLPDNEAPGAK